jgi:hypothetical protein
MVALTAHRGRIVDSVYDPRVGLVRAGVGIYPQKQVGATAYLKPLTVLNGNETNMSEIHERGMLVALKMSAWTARKYDRKISEQVASDHGAAPEAGRYNKTLLPADAPAYKALQQHISATRAEHYRQTLPWSDEGQRLLPVDNYETYQAKMDAAKSTFNTLLRDFVFDYPSLRESARSTLNGMYRAEDYPNVEDLAGKFAFSVEHSPLPHGNDFRLSLPAAERARLEENVNRRVHDGIDAAMRDAWERLHQAVSHIQERLSTPGAIFRDSLIDNTRELCDVLRRLNLTNDPQLEEIRQQTEFELTRFSPDELRSDDRARMATATAAGQIAAAIQRTRTIQRLEETTV